MPHHRPRTSILAAALLVSLAVLAAAAARTTSSTAAAAQLSIRLGASAPPRVSPLLLINGDRLTMTPGPVPGAAVQQPSGDTVPVLTESLGSQIFKIPEFALPYLGRGLSPDLFQLSALKRAERDGRLPVRLSYHGTLPTVPGVTVTRSGHGSAAGYLTGTSAAAFGSALHRQFGADHARGSYGAGGLFSHGLSIELAGGPAPQRAKPNFPMHTLTVTGSNLAGKPDTGDIALVFNLDNPGKLDPASAIQAFYHGTAKFSVPAGRYWAVGLFSNHTSARVLSARVVVLPQFSVSRNKMVHVRDRAATSKITMTTPRPAQQVGTTFTVLRSNHGFTTGVSWQAFGSTPLLVSPVRHRPATGTLHAYSGATLVAPRPRLSPSYRYQLDFPAPLGIIPAHLHYTAHRAGLATVHERFYQDVKITTVTPPGLGDWAVLGGTRSEVDAGLENGAFFPHHMPGSMIQYLSAAPPMFWQGMHAPWSIINSTTEALRRYLPGEHTTEQWNRYPLHPTANISLPGAGLLPVLPSASRTGNTLTLDLTPFGDNQTGHTSASGYLSCLDFGFPCHGRYALYQNGMKIAAGDAVKAAFGRNSPDLFLQATLSHRPSLIKFVLTASRAGSFYLLSPTSKDVWTWRSRPQPGATVPAPWYCTVTTSYEAPVYHRHCAVQPMTMLNYDVAGLTLNGTTSPGRQSVAITAAQIPLARTHPVTHASVQVSFNSGRTWHAAQVGRTSAGHFHAMFQAPANVMVTLRTQAAGIAGTTVTETIQHAYRTTSH